MVKTIENNQKVPFSLKSIIQGMPEIAYVFSEEGNLLTWNKNLEILFGYSKEELNNRFMMEFIYEPDKERVIKKFMKILSDYTVNDRTIEYRIKTKSGKIVPVLAFRSNIFIDGQNYIIGIAIDLRKLKKNKTKIKTQIAEIIHLKNQLQNYYHKIERMNQAEIELEERIFLNAKNFNNKLINNLPGIFYLYEKIGNKFFLKKWNTNYTTDLGYLEDEILNMQPQQFFTKKEFKKAENAILQVFTTGSANVEIYTTHKSGKQIPYFYQGYKFEDNDRVYFMGIGIDISSRYVLEKQKKQHEKEKQKAKEILDTKKRELVTTALEISKTNEIIKSTLKKINNLLEEQTKNESIVEFSNDLIKIKKELEKEITKKDNWEVFKLRFTEVHENFFINLKTKHPELTKSELKYSAYLKIHLSTARIMSILSVSKEAIKKTRYRIRKKLDLSLKDSLEDYIAKF